MAPFHTPVLLESALEGLNIDPEGIYVDATYGGGGHSRAILDKLDNGRLIAFDQDPDVLNNVISDERFTFVNHNFKFFKNFLRYLNIEYVDGIFADLGVSSHHFDEAERGFSFRLGGDLDMRMNPRANVSAADIVNTYDIRELTSVLREYGELKNAGKLARAIDTARSRKKLQTTQDLVEILRPFIPEKFENKFLARVFQALRIEVNQEMRALKKFLLKTQDVVTPGGRLVIITYHSLEDRLVKNFIKKGKFSGEVEKDFYGNTYLPFHQVNTKVITPDEAEIKKNSRARSAKMRIAEKTEYYD